MAINEIETDNFGLHWFDDRDWTKGHLLEWHRAGMSPWGWDMGTMEEFSDWLDENAVDYPHTADWSTLARDFYGHGPSVVA